MHSCDECAEIIGADTTGGRCRVCDFDICQICFNKPAVTDVRVRDLITDVVLPPVPAPPIMTVNDEPLLQMFPIFGRRFIPGEHVIEISDDSDNDIPAVENISYEGFLVYTNKNYGGACRGYGDPQATFAQELMMDMIAEKLDMDPIELRLKNANHPNEKRREYVKTP